MRLFRLQRPAPATVIAMAALFVALGGTGYAVAKLPRNSVGTPQLKKNAVIGAKVKDNALTGADVNEATLGQVPSAASATNAGAAANAANAANANTLDGLDSSAFQRAASQETQHYVIPGGALVDGDSAGRGAGIVSNRWCSHFGSAASADFFGELHLPQGATITGLTVDYLDSGSQPVSNGVVSIDSMPRHGGSDSSATLAMVTLPRTDPSGGESAVSIAATGARRVVDNSKYTYQVTGGLVADFVYICAVDVSHTLPAG